MADRKQRKTFISYSRVNKEFALRLAGELRTSGFNIWLDQLDIPTGSRWDDEVEHALEECVIFMVILTPASANSDNVKDEIGYAIDSGKRILPVLLENATVPLRLRRFQYVDFTTKSYEEGVESAKQLLRNLIEEPTVPKMEVSMAAQTRDAEADRKAKEKADLLASQREKEETARLMQTRVEAERKAREEADRLALQKAEAERLARAEPIQPVETKGVPASSPLPQKKPISKGILAGGVLIVLLCIAGTGFGIVSYFRSLPTEPPVVDPPPIDQPPDTSACPWESGQPVQVTVENRSPYYLDYYWLDYDCQLQYYGSLGAGETMTLDTYVSYIWQFIDPQTGSIYFEYQADGGDYVPILGAVNGYNVNYVEYPGGVFVQTEDPAYWTEYTSDNSEFYFTEEFRDEWSVYLYDEGRNISIQLDLYLKEIYIDYNDGAGQFFLAEIVGSDGQ